MKIDIGWASAISLLTVLVVLVTFAYLYVPVQAAPPEANECIAIGKVGNETLYFCDSDYVDCVWDPSPALGAGVMDCD